MKEKSLPEIVNENVSGLPNPRLPIWAYNVAFAALLFGAGCYWCNSISIDYERFRADNAHGAVANAAERLPCFIGGGALLICAFLCRVIVAIKRLTAEFKRSGP